MAKVQLKRWEAGGFFFLICAKLLREKIPLVTRKAVRPVTSYYLLVLRLLNPSN